MMSVTRATNVTHILVTSSDLISEKENLHDVLGMNEEQQHYFPYKTMGNR